MRIAVPAQAISTRDDAAVRPVGTADARPSDAAAPAATGVALRLGRLFIESDASLATSAIERGFSEAWRRQASALVWRSVSSEAFVRELPIAALDGADGYEIGRRIAEAIIARASGSAATARRR